MVITAGVLYLLERGVADGLCYGMWIAEVHWGAFHGCYFACCHICLVGWSVVVGINIEHHVGTHLRRVAVEVEIAVVGLVNDSLLVCCCLPLNVERIVAQYGVSSGGSHCAREAVVAVGRYYSAFQS